MIAVDQCKDRKLYRVISRNLTIAVFYSQSGAFFGIREKFGDTFTDSEVHRELGGSAAPLEELPETLPNEIILQVRLGTICNSCGVEVAFDQETKWSHVGETGCNRIHPVSNTNTALYNWLMAAQTKYQKQRAT